MANITKGPGHNKGLPDHGAGLDPETRANLTAQAEKVAGKGVLVGSQGDVQKFFGELAKDNSEPTVDIPPGESEDSPTAIEHAQATQTGAAQFDDSYTKQELQDALDQRGVEYNQSDSKDELLAKLNG